MGEGLVDKLRRDAGLALNVTWLPFELHPETPAEGVPLAELFGARAAQIEGMHRQLRHRAEELGLPIEPPSRISNTHKAQLLAEYAKEHYPERSAALHHELFTAYFVHGENMAEDATLHRACERAAVPTEAVAAAVASQECEDRVGVAMAEARMLGITGAPTFIINDRYKIVGAQPYDVLLDAFQQIAGEGA
ncbi:MAG: DsbA family oxidoreductase [Mycobacterium leprae]